MPPENRRRRKNKVERLDTSSWTPEEREAHELEKRLATPVAEMALSVRVVNTLEDNNVLSASDLIAQTYGSLMLMKNFGDKTLAEVRSALSALGLKPPKWKKPPKEKKAPRPKSGDAGVLKFW